jgi:hypothetical protein
VEWPAGSEAKFRGGSVAMGDYAKTIYEDAMNPPPLTSLQAKPLNLLQEPDVQTSQQGLPVAGSEMLQNIFDITDQNVLRVEGREAFRRIVQTTHSMWLEGFKDLSVDTKLPSFEKVLGFLQDERGTALFRSYFVSGNDLKEFHQKWAFLQWAGGILQDLRSLAQVEGEKRTSALAAVRQKIMDVEVECKRHILAPMMQTQMLNQMLNHLQDLRNKLPAR